MGLKRSLHLTEPRSKMPGDVPQPCPIYRILHFENLAQILNQGGIWCGNEMASRNLPYKQIGLQDMTKQRGGRAVPVGRGGNLNDYVPFYFCPKSVMLLQIHTGRVPTYTEGQEPILYLVTTVEKIRELSLRFVFTDRLAKTNYAAFFDDYGRLHELDWATIGSPSFAKTEDDPDRPTRKAAEFLVHRFVPMEAILGIGVYSQKWKSDCDDLLKQAGINLRVQISPKWYYG